MNAERIQAISIHPESATVREIVELVADLMNARRLLCDLCAHFGDFYDNTDAPILKWIIEAREATTLEPAPAVH